MGRQYRSRDSKHIPKLQADIYPYIKDLTYKDLDRDHVTETLANITKLIKYKTPKALFEMISYSDYTENGRYYYKARLVHSENLHIIDLDRSNIVESDDHRLMIQFTGNKIFFTMELEDDSLKSVKEALKVINTYLSKFKKDFEKRVDIIHKKNKITEKALMSLIATKKELLEAEVRAEKYQKKKKKNEIEEKKIKKRSKIQAERNAMRMSNKDTRSDEIFDHYDY